MKKPIFENEEEAELFLQNVFAGPIELHDIFIETFKNIKRKGYIKQSKLEKLKYYYEKSLVDMAFYKHVFSIDDALNAFENSKAYIKELEEERIK